MSDTPSPSLMVDLAKEVDLELDPALKTANSALFHLRNRYAIILKKLAAVDGDERLSAKAKANDEQTASALGRRLKFAARHRLGSDRDLIRVLAELVVGGKVGCGYPTTLRPPVRAAAARGRPWCEGVGAAAPVVHVN